MTYGSAGHRPAVAGLLLSSSDGRTATATLYEHKDSGAIIMIPPFPETDFVLDYHLIGARTTVDRFGITDPRVFDAKLQKAA